MEKLAPLAIVLLTAAVYARAFDAPYVWDDLPLIAQNPTLDDASNIPRYFLEDVGHFKRDPSDMGYYRPLQTLMFHLEVAIFGRRPAVQHAINILFHALAALAVWSLAGTMIRSRRFALLAGLLFAAHPLATEQVCFIADRGGVMAGAFSLWTLALIARAFPDSVPRRNQAIIGAAAVYVPALLSKDEALTMAAPAAAWLYLARPARRKELSSYAAAVLPLAGLALAYIVIRWGILGISHAARTGEVSGGFETRLEAIPRLAFEALRLTLAPAGLRVMRFADYPAWTSAPVAALSAAAWMAIFYFVWRLREKSPAVAFGAFFFAAAFAPSSGVVNLVRPVAEHYYYLPAAGVCIALAGIGAFGYEAAGKNRGIAWGIVAISFFLVAVFSAGTVYRCGFWLSEEKLWADTDAKLPKNATVLVNLGMAAVESGDIRQAFESFNRAAKVNPGYLKARFNRAKAALLLNRTDGVLQDLRTVLSAEPCRENALMQLGALVANGGDGTARPFAEDWAHTHSCAALFEAGAGLAYEEMGRKEEALESYNRFLAALPSHPKAAAVKARIKRSH